MFRAMRLVIAAAILLALIVLPLFRSSAHAAKTILNGVGLVDYTSPPDFKVGTYVSYSTVQSALGISEPGDPVTLLVPGEERFWGDDCFWLETDQGGSDLLTLISYSAFKDSFPQYRMRFYTRKVIDGKAQDGGPNEQLQMTPTGMIKSRTPLPSGDRDVIKDLGPDTVSTPIGTFTCKKMERRRGTGTTQDVGDSTFYTEEYEIRTSYLTPKIPLTHLAREDVDITVTRKSWRIGQSNPNAKPLLVKHSTLSSRVVGYGQGLKSRALPLDRQKSLAELDAQASAGKASKSGGSKPASKTPTKGSAATKGTPAR